MSSQHRFLPRVVACVAWLCALASAFYSLSAYKATAGRAGNAPTEVRFAAAADSDARRVAHLKMFIHPRCPCTRASITELARVLAKAQRAVSVELVIVKPAEASPDWMDTDLLGPLAQRPATRIVCDEGGATSEMYGASTSGHVVLYNDQGQLIFSGGITASRGHEGENESGRRLLRALNDGVAFSELTPVFGCPLLNGTCSPQADGTSCCDNDQVQ